MVCKNNVDIYHAEFWAKVSLKPFDICTLKMLIHVLCIRYYELLPKSYVLLIMTYDLWTMYNELCIMDSA